MRSKVMSLLAAAFSLGVMQTASAADLPTKAPVYSAPAPVAVVIPNWTGSISVSASERVGRTSTDR